MKFEEALKITRRNVFVHSDKWRTAVICKDAPQLAVAWDEARYLIEASSLKLEKANYATRTLFLERGAIIRFFSVDDLRLDRLRGHEYTHIMWLYGGEYDAWMLEDIRPRLRSSTIDADKLLWQEYVVI